MNDKPGVPFAILVWIVVGLATFAIVYLMLQ